MNQEYNKDSFITLASIANALCNDKQNILKYARHNIVDCIHLNFDKYNMRVHATQDSITIKIENVNGNAIVAEVVLGHIETTMTIKCETSEEVLIILKEVLEDVSVVINDGYIKGTLMLNKLFQVYTLSMLEGAVNG